MLRRVVIIACGVAALAAAGPAHAGDMAPSFVVPSRPGIPVVLHGRDVSYTVVEGDWGLARPGFMTPNIIGYAPPVGDRASPLQGIYHPRYGYPPPRGRFEIEPPPNRVLPEPAESYRRSWSTDASPSFDPPPVIRAQPNNLDVVPPTIVDPQQMNPPIVIAPQVRPRWRH